MATKAEQVVAVLEARFNAHEASCNERMKEVRDTFVEVKTMNKTTHSLVVSLLISVVLLMAGAILTLFFRGVAV
jgi:hypothetical protein